jgi:hypothetical protein
LALLLAVLLLGAVATVEAAGSGAKHAVMAGIMARDAADHGALQTAIGIGGRTSAKRNEGDGGSKKCSFHDAVSPKQFRITNGCAVAAFCSLPGVMQLPLRDCDPTGRAKARPMTGSANQSIAFSARLNLADAHDTNHSARRGDRG